MRKVLLATALIAVLLPAVPASADPPRDDAVSAGSAVRADLAAAADSAGNVRAIIKLKAPALTGKPQRASLRSATTSARSTVENALRGVPHQVHRRYQYAPYLTVTAPVAEIERLAASGQIADARPDTLDYATLADSTRIVGAAEATSHGADGTNQVVAILDTGVDRAHTMFTGRIVAEACFSDSGHCPNGTTTQTGAGAGVPCTFHADCSHGTHVAGIAAGRNNNGVTVTGVAPAAGIMAINVFSRSTNCLGQPVCPGTYRSDQIAALDHVADQRFAGVNVVAVNMSLGSVLTSSTHCDTDERKAPIDLLRSLGVATVIASGNSSSITGVSTPACISTAVVVGNTTKADEVWNSSNSSPLVDLLAPGTSITSSVPGGGLGVMTGTSMAAPHVTGALAVYLERFPGTDVTTMVNSLADTGVLINDPRNSVTKPRINISAALARWGFVYANQPTTGLYTPNTDFQGNSTGGTSFIERTGAGAYRVIMPGLGALEQSTGGVAGGTVNVTAHSSSARRCKVIDWYYNPGAVEVAVQCHNAAGTATDSAFTLLYRADETTRPLLHGYAWVNSDGSVPLAWQANSSDPAAVNGASRTGTGLYSVFFYGLFGTLGNAQVTAQGGGSAYCKLRGVTNTRGGVQVDVACYSAAGTLTDSAFNVEYMAGDFAHNRGGLYGLANQSSQTSWYTMADMHTARAAGQARRVSTGVYEVKWLSGSAVGGNPTVTALGTNATTCGVQSWSQVGADVVTRVNCRNAAGTLTNSQFSFLYLTRHL